MAKHITLQRRKFSVEFRDSQTARGHGGQLAVAALLDQFGLKERVAREPALDRRTHCGKGFEPIVYVTQALHSFTSGGVSLADAARLNEDEPLKAFLGVEKLPDQKAVGEWLRDIGEPGWQALRRISREFVAWALGRAEPACYRHLGRTECFFDDTQIEVSGDSFEGAAMNYEGPLALSWQVLLVGSFLADHILGATSDTKESPASDQAGKDVSHRPPRASDSPHRKVGKDWGFISWHWLDFWLRQRHFQNPVAADVSPRHWLEFAPTHVGGYGVLKEPRQGFDFLPGRQAYLGTARRSDCRQRFPVSRPGGNVSFFNRERSTMFQRGGSLLQ